MAISKERTQKTTSLGLSLCVNDSDCVGSWLIPLKWKKMRTKVTEVRTFSPYHYLISVLDSFSCTKKPLCKPPVKEFLCIRAKITSVPSLLYFLLRFVWQRGWDQRAPALPLTFTSNRFNLFTTSHLLHCSYGRDFFNVRSIATYFLAVSVLTLKQRSSYLFIHRYSKLFLIMWVSTLSSNGFVRWKWVWNIVYYVPICLINIILFLICCFSSQDGSWDSNLSTYFNMNTYLDIILSCVLQQAGKRRIVFSCFDPDICTMWVHGHAYVDVRANSLTLSL